MAHECAERCGRRLVRSQFAIAQMWVWSQGDNVSYGNTRDDLSNKTPLANLRTVTTLYNSSTRFREQPRLGATSNSADR